MILVDELRALPITRPPFHRALACYLTTSNVGLDDLHAFAELLGLPRWSFEPAGRPHYKITKTKRTLALHRGATFIPSHRQAAFRMGLCTFETMVGPHLAKVFVAPLNADRGPSVSFVARSMFNGFELRKKQG